MSGQEARDDEREALADLIEGVGVYVPGSHSHDYINPIKAADAMLAAGYRRYQEADPSEQGYGLIREARAAIEAKEVTAWALAGGVDRLLTALERKLFVRSSQGGAS